MRNRYLTPKFEIEHFLIEDAFTVSNPVITTDAPIGVGGVTGDGYIDYDDLFK